MSKTSWRELEARRQALPRKVSRAELARRAGLSESTIAKGIREDRTPRKAVRDQVNLILEAEKIAGEAGL